MTFYQELQLNQAGSKKLICASETKKEKYRHIAVYLFKIILTISFCVVFVTLFSMIFGTENSVAGVVILLALLTFRQADLGIHTAHSAAALTIIFGILAAGPRAACVLPPFAALFVNAGCILLIMVLGCYPVAMSNQSTFVLGYLLLMGYDVSGQTYLLRLAGLGIGGAAVILIFLRSHRNRSYEKKFSDLFREFSLSSDRTRWQICLALGVSTALLIAQLLSVPRGMWIGIAVMSVLQPLRKDLQYRLKFRAPGNILGGALFLLLYHFLPGDICAYIGIIGESASVSPQVTDGRPYLILSGVLRWRFRCSEFRAQFCCGYSTTPLAPSMLFALNESFRADSPGCCGQKRSRPLPDFLRYRISIKKNHFLPEGSDEAF